jgi:3-hydroxy-9,10-secoandrosta-1,3,5(10)-triene-9,17-dione monooxygenase
MTPEEYLERVRDVLPAIRERAARAEALRRLPEETVADFQRLGLFRCVQPKRYEGYELDLVTFYRAVMEVAAVCGSTGWTFGVVAVHNWHLALLSARAQEDVWGADPSTLISTSLAPTGSVERVVGGFRLRGRWSFSSGCDYCHWAVLGGTLPAERPGDPPEMWCFLVPRRDYAIEDNWHVMGLCGSGSKALIVEDAFVPAHRSHSYRDAFLLRNPGAAVNDAPLYRLPFGLVFASTIAAPALGAAQGAVDLFRAQSKARVGGRDRTPVSEDPFIQLHLAEAAADVDAARTRLLANFTEMMRLAEAGSDIPLAQRARYRWDAVKAVEWSVGAVDRVLEASGGSAVYLSNPIQRAWRDVHAMRAHAGNNPEKAAAVFGRSELGLPPLDIRF